MRRNGLLLRDWRIFCLRKRFKLIIYLSIMSKYSQKTETGKCVFCEIALGNKTPQGNGKYWESEKYIAWLSPFPNTEGFTVVIPKKHYTSDVLKMPDNELSDFIIEVKNISKLLLEYFPNVGRIGLIMEGTGIDHAHIKLIPMHGTEHMKRNVWKQYSSNKDDYYEEYKGFLSSHDGPKADFDKISELANKLKELKLSKL